MTGTDSNSLLYYLLDLAVKYEAPRLDRAGHKSGEWLNVYQERFYSPITHDTYSKVKLLQGCLVSAVAVK